MTKKESTQFGLIKKSVQIIRNHSLGLQQDSLESIPGLTNTIFKELLADSRDVSNNVSFRIDTNDSKANTRQTEMTRSSNTVDPFKWYNQNACKIKKYSRN